MIADELGRYIDRLTESFNGRDYERLARLMLSAPDKFLERFENGAFAQVVRASAVGYTLQAGALGYTDPVPEATRATWQARGQTHAALLTAKAQAQIGGGLSQDGAHAWLRAASYSAAWRGVDAGQTDAARAAGSDWKTWVRAWRRKESRTHSSLEGLTIPIDDLFTLPSGRQCWGPRDWDAVPDPAEWVYCGHALTYSYGPSPEQTDRTLLYSPVSRELRRITRVNAPPLPTLPSPAAPIVPAPRTRR